MAPLQCCMHPPSVQSRLRFPGLGLRLACQTRRAAALEAKTRERLHLSRADQLRSARSDPLPDLLCSDVTGPRSEHVRSEYQFEGPSSQPGPERLEPREAD